MNRRSARVAGLAAATVAVVVAGVMPVPASAAEPADVTPPTIVDAGLSFGAVVNGDVVVRPVVTDDVAVARVELVADGYPQVQSDAAPWTLAWNTRRFVDEDLDLDLIVYDAAGNRSVARVPVRADNWGPIVGFRIGTNQTVKGVVPLEFTVTEFDSDLARIDVTVGTKLIGTATAAPWKIMWNTKGHNGPTTLTARLRDVFGNTRTATAVVMVDYAGPQMKLFYPATPGYISSRDTIWADLSDDAGIARVELLINGRRIRSLTDGDTTVALPWDPRARNGTVTMTVRAYDRLGNVTVHTRKVLVDNDDPVVRVVPGAAKKVRGTFTAGVVSIRDATGTASVETIFNGRRTRDTTAPFTIGLNSRAVRDGARPLSWIVTDRAGNSEYVDQFVQVDNTAPSVSFGSAPNDRAKVRGTVTITAKANDYYGVNRVELLLNGKVIRTDRTRPFTFSVATKKYGKKMTVQLRAIDNAGNTRLGARRTWTR